MSELTEQIKEKCSTIAENQKKVYDLGFKEGKASVKLIKFMVSNADRDYCAITGMTWREYVDSDVNNGDFKVENGVVYFVDEYTLDVGLDDEIIENGYYELNAAPDPFTLRYGEKTYTLYRQMNEVGVYDVPTFVNSSHNTLGLYLDDEGCLRTPTGEWVYYVEYGDSMDYISEWTKINTDSYSFSSYDYFIAERDCDCEFSVLGYTTLYCPLGMTWQDFVNSKFNDSVSIIDDEIVQDYEFWSGALTLNGVKVLPSDVIVNGATYEGTEE